eukprot:scaffold449905_cov53-Prasinocladus_malaysianus.AAC.1
MLAALSVKELEIRRRKLSPAAVLQALTINCAELFEMKGQIGKVAPGHFADLVLLEFNPLEEFEKLYESKNVAVVLKEGRVVKALPGSPFEGFN